MKIFDRLLGIFGRNRAGMVGALSEQNDLKSCIYAIRAQTYLRLTGKVFPAPPLLKQGTDFESSMRDLSPSRRLARKGL